MGLKTIKYDFFTRHLPVRVVVSHSFETADNMCNMIKRNGAITSVSSVCPAVPVYLCTNNNVFKYRCIIIYVCKKKTPPFFLP